MAVVINRLNGGVTIHEVANATYTVAGNNSVSNLATNAEILSGASINKIWWGATAPLGVPGYWEIKRGSNTVVSGLTHAGYMDFSAGNPIKKDSAGTLVITLNGTTAGFIQIELKKEGTLPIP